MLEIINLIFISILQVISCTFVVQCLSKKRIEYNLKNIVILVAMTFAIYFMLQCNFGIYKPFAFFIVLIYGYKYISKLTMNESIIINFISLILNIVSEVVMGILIVILRIPNEFIYKYLSNTPISNLLMLSILLILIKFFKKYLFKLKEIMEIDKITYIFYFVLVVGMTLILSKNIGNWQINIEFIINMIIIILFIVIIISLFGEKYKTYKKTEEFNSMYKQSQSIKTLLNRYKKHNHENNNQLIVIRENSLNNEKVVKYIDSILTENVGHEDKWISELSYIKDPGISGFLSVKINQMLDNKIKVSLMISPKVKKYKFEAIKPKQYKELCRVIGIYLDNAYEASKKTRKKEVTIEMLMDKEKLVIIISNSFKGKIELDKIDKEGYTTKGKNHGVGLSIVKDIVTSNKKLEQKREVIKDYFYQYLYVGK